MTDGRGGIPQDDLAVVLRAHEVADPAPAFRHRLRERLMALELPVLEQAPPDASPATGPWTGLAPLVAGGLVLVMAIILSRSAPWGPGARGTDSPAPPSGAPEEAGRPAPVLPRGPSPDPVTPTETKSEATAPPAPTTTEASEQKESPASIPASPTEAFEAPPDQPPPANRPPDPERPPDQPAATATATVGPPPSTASPPPPPPSPTPLASPAPRPTATPMGLDPGTASAGRRTGSHVTVARARALGPPAGLGLPSPV